jgi:glycosyltransferase involved in cell wall biosynthesis
MNKIKVYLQYPWKFPDSPYYKYLTENPPKDIKYLSIEKQKGVITNKRFFLFSNFLKKNIRRFANLLHLTIPNAHLSPEGDYDLIHCAHCLSKNKDKPWVADFERVWQMFVGIKDKNSIKKSKEILLRDNCKKIIAWTEESNKQIAEDFPEIKNKIEVIYPAVPITKIKKKKHKTINLLFVGRYFYQKGGLHALDVIDRLTRKYKNVNGIIVSEIPEEVKKKYSSNNKVKFDGLIPQRELLTKIFPISDILIYPGYSDSFGFILLEAMSFGIPIVTVEGVARKEIVQEGKTGFVVERPTNLDIRKINHILVRKLLEKSSRLIGNKKLRERMSKNCIKEIKNGRFSIKEMNKKLKKIYEGVIK